MVSDMDQIVGKTVVWAGELLVDGSYNNYILFDDGTYIYIPEGDEDSAPKIKSDGHKILSEITKEKLAGFEQIKALDAALAKILVVPSV